MLSNAYADKKACLLVLEQAMAGYASKDKKAAEAIERIKTLEALTQQERAKQSKSLLFEASSKAAQVVGHKKFASEIKDVETYFQNQTTSPLTMLNNFQFSNLLNWLKYKKRRDRVQKEIATIAAKRFVDLEHDYINAISFQNAAKQAPDNGRPREYTLKGDGLRLFENHLTHSEFMELPQKIRDKVTETVLALVKPKPSEGVLNYLQRAYREVDESNRVGKIISEEEFYKSAMAQEPKFFHHILTELKGSNPSLADKIELAVFKNANNELNSVVAELQKKLEKVKPNTGSSSDSTGSGSSRSGIYLNPDAYGKSQDEVYYEEVVKPMAWRLAKIAAVAIPAAFLGGHLSDDEEELKELEGKLKEQKSNSEAHSNRAWYAEKKNTQLEAQIESAQSRAQHSEKMVKDLSETEQKQKEELSAKAQRIEELERMTKELQAEYDKLENSTPHQQRVLSYMKSMSAPSTNESARMLLTHFNQALPPPEQKSEDEWAGHLRSLAPDSKANTSPKESFEKKLLAYSKKSEIIYNSVHTNPLSFIETSKGQCFSMTNAYMLSQMLSKPEEFQKKNPLYIQLEGHVLSGLMIPTQNPEGKPDFKLVGFEHTASGKAEIDFGFASQLHKFGKGMRLLEPEYYSVINAGSQVASKKLQISYLEFSLKDTAKKYGVNLTELEKLVANTKATQNSNNDINSSISSFGDVRVRSGDHKRQTLGQVTFGTANESVMDVVNGGATLSTTLDIRNLTESSGLRNFLVAQSLFEEHPERPTLPVGLVNVALSNNMEEHSKIWEQSRSQKVTADKDSGLEAYFDGLAIRHLISEDKDLSIVELREILKQSGMKEDSFGFELIKADERLKKTMYDNEDTSFYQKNHDVRFFSRIAEHFKLNSLPSAETNP